MSNYYNKLDVNEDMDISRKKEVRTAKKILKYINELKTNRNLNDDQKAKINTEHMWHKVLDPSYKSAEEKQELEKENQREAAIKNKKREKKRTEAAIKNKIHKQEQIAKKVKLQQKMDETKAHRAQLEKELDEIKARRKKKEEAQRKKKEEEERKKKEEEEEEEECADTSQLKTEFNLLTREEGLTKRRAKHKLLLKYHPDKNRQMSEKRSTIMTQLINKEYHYL